MKSQPAPLRPHHLRYFLEDVPVWLSKVYGKEAAEAMLDCIGDIPLDAEIKLVDNCDELCLICDADDPPCPSQSQEREMAEKFGLEIGRTYKLSELIDAVRNRV